MVGLLGLVMGDGDSCRLGDDFDRFGSRGHLRGEGLGLSDRHLQILDHVGGKPGKIEAERIEAGVDPAQDVFAEIRSEGLACGAAALVGRGDGHPGEDGPGLAVDVAADGAGVGLGAQQDGARE